MASVDPNECKLGAARYAKRIAQLANNGVALTIAPGKGPAKEQLLWNLSHPSRTPPELLSLKFIVTLGFDETPLSLSVNLDAILRIFNGGHTYELLGYLYHTQGLELHMDTPDGLSEEGDWDVYILYDPRLRDGYVVVSEPLERVLATFVTDELRRAAEEELQRSFPPESP